jgi:hypothetical protein
MEHVFFKGTWPKQGKQPSHQVTDAVRMSAGIMLVSHGWGTPPNSTDIKITLPQADSTKHITSQMTMEEAADVYARTVAAAADVVPRQIEGPDEPATIEGEFLDVTPANSEEGDGS